MIPSSSLLSGMVDAALRSLLVAAAVGLGLAALRARNVVAQKAAWMLVLCAAVLMPVLAPWASQTAWVPAQAIIRIPRVAWPLRSTATTVIAQPVNALPEREPSLKTGPAGSAPIAHTESAPPAGIAGTHFPAPAISYASSGSAYVPASAPPKTSEISISAAGVAVLLYGLVCAVLLGRVAWGAWAAARLWFSAETITLYPHEAASELKLRASRGIASPVTVGSGIVLPEDYTEWDSEKLRIVLAHEASHVRQRDFYVQLGASLYASLFWFSPLGWWLKRKLSDLSETISDRAAVEHAASHASYAQVLLEFAALPHPIPTGVAMARKGRLVSRIERLLNESSFRQAFSGGRARIAAAILLVPASLFAATALVRVEAGAAQSSDVQPPPPAKAPAAPSRMDAPPAAPAIAGQPAPPAPADQAPAAPPAPAIVAVPPSGPAAPAIPPPPADAVVIGSGLGSGNGKSWSVNLSQSETTAEGSHRSGSSFSLKGKGYAYSYQNNGNSYALISGNDNVTFSGDWYDGRKAELDKAKRMAHGDFLWFTRNGKSYVMDDPQTIAQIKGMYAPIEALGKQQEELGHRQEELGKKQEALGNQQEQASVPTPEMTKEMAAVEKAMQDLKAAKGQSLSQDKLADIQEKLADLQARLADMQGEVGEKQGALGEQQGKLGEQQGKLGEQQGKLGEQQGRLAVEVDKKIKSIIDESLKNGKARPVE